MTAYPCTFSLPSSGNSLSKGAKLLGSGFGCIPSLMNGDTIQVTVSTTQPNPPATLNGYMIISPAQDASNQTTPSPFKNGQRYICYWGQTATGQTNQGMTTYAFDVWTYTAAPAQALKGNYELTFVAEDALTNPAEPTQWSEDPEFDTGE
jgi:hypothetical protein